MSHAAKLSPCSSIATAGYPLDFVDPASSDGAVHERVAPSAAAGRLSAVSAANTMSSLQARTGREPYRTGGWRRSAARGRPDGGGALGVPEPKIGPGSSAGAVGWAKLSGEGAPAPVLVHVRRGRLTQRGGEPRTMTESNHEFHPRTAIDVHAPKMAGAGRRRPVRARRLPGGSRARVRGTLRALLLGAPCLRLDQSCTPAATARRSPQWRAAKC